jgi:hypothetical protein
MLQEVSRSSDQTRHYDVVNLLSFVLPSPMSLLRSVITVALPGLFMATQSGGGLPRDD